MPTTFFYTVPTYYDYQVTMFSPNIKVISDLKKIIGIFTLDFL